MSGVVGWKGFLAWAAAGGLLVFAVVSGLSIGLFVLPLAVVILVLVVRRVRGWPEILGAGAGCGAICLLIAFLNRDYNPCPEGPITLGPGESEFECGGFDPLPWLVAGLALVALSTLTYAFARRSPTRPSTPLGLSKGETIALLLALAVAAFGLTAVLDGVSESGGGAGGELAPTTVEGSAPGRP